MEENCGPRLPAWGLWSTPSIMGGRGACLPAGGCGPCHPVWGTMVHSIQYGGWGPWSLPSSIENCGSCLPALGAVVHTIQHGGPWSLPFSMGAMHGPHHPAWGTVAPHLLAWRTVVPQITRQYKSFVPKLLFSAVLVTVGSVINSCTVGHSRCNGRAVQRTCEAFSTTSLFLSFSPSLLSFPGLSSTSMAVIVFVTFLFL